jgi:hypothetical protein
MVKLAARSVPKKSRRQTLADDNFAAPRLQALDDLTGVLLFREVLEGRNLQAKHVVVAAVGIEHDSRMRDGQAKAAASFEQPDRVVARLGDIAAAEPIGIVEAVDEIDDQQRRPLAEAEAPSEILAFVNVDFGRHEFTRRLAPDATSFRRWLHRGS